MPIYEYHCNGCDGDFEVIQKVSDRPIRKCELCGKLRAKRKISQTNFVLKGSGWYATDYANKPKKSAKPSKKETQSKSAETKSSDSGSVDKKPASEKSA